MIKRVISWKDYLRDCQVLSDCLVKPFCLKKMEKKFKIYGVPRGGLIPAVIVSHRLGCVYTERIEEADVVIDDLYDTGCTYNRLQKKTKAIFFFLYSKRYGTEISRCVKKFPEKVWLQLPYESERSTLCKDMERFNGL